MSWLGRRSERLRPPTGAGGAWWLVLALAGCGGSGGAGADSGNAQVEGGVVDSSGPSDAGVDGAVGGDADAGDDAASRACDAYAQAYCAKLGSCEGLAFETVFGSAQACQQRVAQFCPDRFVAPGTGTTPSAMTACAAAITAQSCGAFRTGLPAACVAKGSRGAGQACRYDAQCQSSFCSVPVGSPQCGTCQPSAAEGEACDPSVANCANGLVCADSGCTSDGSPCSGTRQTICVSPREEGEACHVSADCVPPLRCFQDLCVMPAELGGPCTGNGCDDTGALYCASSADGGSSTCVGASFAAVGAACNSISQSPVLCEGSGSCRSLTGTAADVGKCAAPAADGQSCIDALCVPPAACVSGICQPPVTASSCM